MIPIGHISSEKQQGFATSTSVCVLLLNWSSKTVYASDIE